MHRNVRFPIFTGREMEGVFNRTMTLRLNLEHYLIIEICQYCQDIIIKSICQKLHWEMSRLCRKFKMKKTFKDVNVKWSLQSHNDSQVKPWTLSDLVGITTMMTKTAIVLQISSTTCIVTTAANNNQEMQRPPIVIDSNVDPQDRLWHCGASWKGTNLSNSWIVIISGGKCQGVGRHKRIKTF